MEEGKLEIKLTQLQMMVEKTNAVISSSNSEAIERHYQTLKTITADVSRLRLGVEAKKIEAKEQMEKKLKDPNLERRYRCETRRSGPGSWKSTPMARRP